MKRTFRDSLLIAIENSGKSLKSVADATGVSYEQLKKLKQNKSKSTNVDDAIKIAAFFGQTLDEFIACDGASVEIEIAGLLSKLTPSERDFLLNAAKAQIAARDPDKQKSPEDR